MNNPESKTEIKCVRNKCLGICQKFTKGRDYKVLNFEWNSAYIKIFSYVYGQNLSNMKELNEQKFTLKSWRIRQGTDMYECILFVSNNIKKYSSLSKSHDYEYNDV